MTYNMSAFKRRIHSIRPTAAVAFLLLATVMPSAAQAALLTQDLELGMTSSDVTSLQSFLSGSASIYPEGIVSGYFGSLTRAAVIRFQAANDLPTVGRVGPLTRSVINAQMGGGVSTGGGNSSGDQAAPIMFPWTVTTGSNSLTFSWALNEGANSRVMYGSANGGPFRYSTAASVRGSGFGSTASIVVPGLASKSTYHYVLESIDGAGNITWTVAQPVTTQ